MGIDLKTSAKNSAADNGHAAAKASLDDLQPAGLWKHFFALCAIPHGSKNEQAAIDYVLAQAKQNGLAARRDAAGNVVVLVPATKDRQAAKATVLQSHLDMVCEKNEDKTHDFLRDPLTLLRQGDLLKADGTTLGADNGIGVAAQLAVMEAKDLNHGPLELLFTVDEETGLTGAFNLDPKLLAGRQLINLDTEEESAVYIGCAGGMDSVASSRISRTDPTPGKKSYRLKITGLRGGHSGADIHQGRGNALKVAARVLRSLGASHGLEVVSIEGGSKRNAIAREAFVVFYVDFSRWNALQADVAKIEHELREELGSADPDVSLQIETAVAEPAQSQVIDAADCQRIASFLYACPHGVLAMAPDIHGLVQTSTNLAIIHTTPDAVVVSMSHRSSVESAKLDVARMIADYCALAGFSVKQGAGYPGWKPNVDSPLLATAKKVHADLFGQEPLVKAVHAGLECGIIGEKFPEMEMISIGPTIRNPHSPDESVDIPSVANFWNYLTALLGKI